MMKRFFLKLIRLYQKGISPYTQPHCNYVPTCSAYAVEAIRCHGAVKGGILALWRLLRCNPFSRGGYDPVPERFTLRRQYKVYALEPRTPFSRRKK
jgi:hypothetical protein